MLSIVRFIYYVTGFLFLVMILLAYYQFAPMVKVAYSANTELFEYVSKEKLFYLGSAVFLFFNILLSIGMGLVKKIRSRVLAFANTNQWIGDLDTREALVKVYTTWFTTLKIFINILLFIVFFALYNINVLEKGSFVGFGYAIYACMAAIVLALLSLPIYLNLDKDTF
jgi:hypothetical protein